MTALFILGADLLTKKKKEETMHGAEEWIENDTI